MHCRLVYKINDKIIYPEFFNKISFEACNCCKDKKVQHIICDINYSPHMDVLRGNEIFYIEYMKRAGKYAGYGIEHSLEKFEYLIKHFDKNKMEEIKFEIVKNKKVITDGLHRFCILNFYNF